MFVRFSADDMIFAYPIDERRLQDTEEEKRQSLPRAGETEEHQ